MTPYGFSGFVGSGYSADFASYWTDYVVEKRYVAGYLALNPLFPDPAPFDNPPSFNSAYVMDLGLGSARLFAGLDENRRREVRAWEKRRNTCLLDESNVDEFSEFLRREFPLFLERVSARPDYYFTGETLDALCRSKNVVTVGTFASEGLAGICMFGCADDNADFLLNVAVPDARGGTTACIWHAMDYLQSIGMKSLNLGGGVRPGDRLAEAKRRFGGKELPLRALRQVYDPATFAELNRKAGRNATDAYFPPYHQGSASTVRQE